MIPACPMKRPLFWPTLLIAVTALGAYGNSFGGPFIFDDHLHITNNPRIRNLWPPWEIIAGTPRPVVYLSLALNHFISGLHAWSYHAVNLAVHVAAAWLLFGIVHRTLQGAPLRDRFGPSSHLFALATALLWVAHPLQTESVTYIIQRAESLMGLFFLLALYSVIRGAGSPHRDRWAAAAVLSCAMGMGCKPVMVSAPLVILL